MIGKAKACEGGAILAQYVMKPQKGYELMRNGLSGDTPDEIFEEMRTIQDLNQRAKNRTFSLVLSPLKKEGWELSDSEWKAMAIDFLTELGIDPQEQQFVAFIHTEKEHKHLHILANRVDFQGRLLSDHHIGKKAHWAAHRIAKKHGLTSAKEKLIDKLEGRAQESNRIKFIRKEMKNKHELVLQKNPRSIQEYISLMRKLNIKVRPVFHKFSGELQGLRMKDIETGMDFKASDVHRSMSLNKIIAQGIPWEAPTTEKEYKKQKAMAANPHQSIRSLLLSSGVLSNDGQSEGHPKKRRRKREERDNEIGR